MLLLELCYYPCAAAAAAAATVAAVSFTTVPPLLGRLLLLVLLLLLLLWYPLQLLEAAAAAAVAASPIHLQEQQVPVLWAMLPALVDGHLTWLSTTFRDHTLLSNKYFTGKCYDKTNYGGLKT